MVLETEATTRGVLHNARHDPDITDDRSRPSDHSLDSSDLPFAVALAFAVLILFVIHIFGIAALLTAEVGSVFWLVRVAYLLYLGLKILYAPYELAILHGGFGLVWVAIVDQSLAGTVAGVTSPTLLLSEWLTALVAILWWIWRSLTAPDAH